MWRLGTSGIKLQIPCEISSSGYRSITAFGACIGITAYAPAAAELLNFCEAYGPTTHYPCRGCNYCQIPGHDDLMFPGRRVHSFLPWTKAGPKVWNLRTNTDLQNTRASHANTPPAMLIKNGLGLGITAPAGEIEHAFYKVPRFDATWAPFGVMHVEAEGNAKVHIPAFVYMLVRVLQWTSIEAINFRLRNFDWMCPAADKPQEFRHATQEGTDAGTPSSDTSVGWKAMSVHAFMLRGIEFFQHFVPKGHEKEESWVCFKLHCLYYALLQKTSFEKIDIVNLDSLICKQQTLFLKIDHYVDLWKPKNHWATHFPVDIIRFGPPVYWSELKFEMKHQWLKRCARLSNFIGLLSTIAFNSEMRACLDLFEGVHLNFIRE